MMNEEIKVFVCLRNQLNNFFFNLKPASIDELRKWTSKEAIGDETVAPNCVARVSHNTSIAAADTSVISLRPAIGVSPEDCTDSIIMITSQNASSRSNDEDKDSPLDHRLPSPEEQCQILASKYVQ